MSGGGSAGSSDTRYSRRGTAGTTNWRDLTPTMENQFSQGTNALAPGSMGGDVNTHVTNTLGRTACDEPYAKQMLQIVGANMPGAPMAGEASLRGQAAVDPYSESYGQNTFDSYQQGLEKSLAQVSGPTATRGGTAAQGFMGQEMMNSAGLQREEVLSQNRRADAGIQQGASAALHSMEAGNTSEALQGIGQAQGDWQQLLGQQNNAAGVGNQQTGMFSDLIQNYANLAGVTNGTETNNLSGRGSQSSSSMGASASLCCFIFLESYGGELPWYVRLYRDVHAPEESDRRKGYITMSKWVVPAMRVSKTARWLTNKLMVQPLTKWGGWHYGAEGCKLGWVYYPAVRFWFSAWKHLGKLQTK